MFNRPAKRKYERRENTSREPNIEPSRPDPVLYVQAHEADIIRGSQAHALARLLEAQHAEGATKESPTRLIRWQTSTDDLMEGGGSAVVPAKAIWVDRYDVRLLLDTRPRAPPPGASDNSRLSPSGWSDLPSDTEDTFFFSPDEVDDYHREKRRRMIDQSREERLRALRAELGEEEDTTREEDVWGGSDEEPDESQKDLMRRTAKHLFTSPNAAQLEMRILANHGADKRFAFLRGRWSRAWKITKSRARLELDTEKAKKTDEEPQKVGLGGLTGYGDSDASDCDDEGKKDIANSEDHEAKDPDEALREARRGRAKEWAEKRRAMKEKEQKLASSLDEE